jgi:uncharacterized protein (TIGR02231 family)
MRYLLLILLTLSAYASEIEVASEVDEVTVFNDRAFVTRGFRKKITKGAHSIVIKELPTSIYQDSLKVKTNGERAIKVLGVRFKKVELEQTNNKELKDLKEKRDLAQKKRDENIKRIQKIVNEYNNLNEAQKLYKESFAINLQNKKWSRKNFMAFVDYAKTKKFNFVNDWKKQYRELIEVYDELEYLNAKINELNSVNKISTFSVYIDLESSKTGSYDLSLQYLVPNAGWEPSYDIRVNSKNNTAKLSQYALVWQKTGEDWEKARIILSNRTTKLKTTPPHISGYTLRYQEVKEVKTSIQSTTDNASSLKGGVNPGTEKSTEVTFRASGIQTIQSGRPKTRVFIKSKTFSYQENLELVARKYDHVFKRGRLVNNLPWALNPGRAYIYYDGEFIQNFQLDRVNQGQEFFINAGIDYDFKVSNWHKDKNENKGIINSKKVYKRNFYTRLESFANKTKKIRVLSQYPVSETKEINVKTDGSTEGMKTLENYPSWGAWELSVPANSSKQLT